MNIEQRTNDEIPLPLNRVILLDKDLTLVNSNYQSTDPQIYDVIKQMQADGWIIGISSDTGLQTLLEFREEFGLNGPTIAERGAIIKTDDEIIFDEEDVDILAKSRKNMEEALILAGITVIQGGISLPRRNQITGNPGDIVAIVNTVRKASIGFNIRKILEDGTYGFDEETTLKVVELLQPFYPQFPDLVEDINHLYGVLIVSRQKTNKRTATQTLMEREGLQQIAMVGNAMTDYIGSDIALHYAVGNATEDFKAKSDYITQGEITAGVVEILTKLRNVAKK